MAVEVSTSGNCPPLHMGWITPSHARAGIPRPRSAAPNSLLRSGQLIGRRPGAHPVRKSWMKERNLRDRSQLFRRDNSDYGALLARSKRYPAC